jgi:predicted transcriptional regulator
VVIMVKRKPQGDGEWLKAARDQMGLSQGQLGALLGVGQVAICHYETGRNKRLGKLARREVIRLLSLSAEERAALLKPMEETQTAASA